MYKVIAHKTKRLPEITVLLTTFQATVYMEIMGHYQSEHSPIRCSDFPCHTSLHEQWEVAWSTFVIERITEDRN